MNSNPPPPRPAKAPLHPLIRELFEMLPPPGSEFKVEDRVRWLIAARAVLDLVYPTDGTEPISISARTRSHGPGHMGNHVGDR